MGNVSTEWLAAISTGRDYSIDEKKKGCAVPVTPWLHPPVGKRPVSYTHLTLPTIA